MLDVLQFVRMLTRTLLILGFHNSLLFLIHWSELVWTSYQPQAWFYIR
jgi:hypothetical protein